MTTSRRGFLARSARAGGLALALAALPSWLRDAIADGASGSDLARSDLIERNAWPEHLEATVAALGRTALTPNRAFFVRSHLPVPMIDTATFRLEIGGLVGRALSFSLAELRRMPASELTCTLECAGNGRGLMALSNTSGTQWGLGAVGNARWRGVSLASLLERAGIATEAKHVWLEAADRGVLPGVPPFLRSIPIALARGDALVAYAMNGRALPPLHGAPLRAIVPGWYGMASTKWLTGIRVHDAPSDNHFMARGYRFVVAGADPTASPPVEELRVKSLITHPLDGAHVGLARLAVEGVAWASSAGVRSVEISGDDGATWTKAGLLDAGSQRYAWRRWRAQLAVDRAGLIALLARATDGHGTVQPRVAELNAGGYGNNSMHRVVVTAHA